MEAMFSWSLDRGLATWAEALILSLSNDYAVLLSLSLSLSSFRDRCHRVLLRLGVLSTTR